MTFFRLIPTLVLVMGLCFLGAAGYQWYALRQFEQGNTAARGYVVALNATRGHQPSYAPTVQYLRADGRVAVYHHDVFSRPSQYFVGQEVTVCYDPARPDRARLGGEYFGVYVLSGLGAGFTLVGSLLGGWRLGRG
jgi:hypothetical protein